MIAIPLEQNHDLLLELESVQRGILYHCPLLIGACVAPVVARMPLLLIDTENNSSGGGGVSTNDLFGRRGNVAMVGGSISSSDGEDDLLTSRDPITKALHEILNDVVDEYVYKADDGSIEGNADNEDLSQSADEENEDRDGKNDKNIQPIMMKFKGLEIDGDLNEVLHAIGTEDSATPMFRQMLNEITKRIEDRGWKVHLPEDNPQGKNGGLDEDGVTWRPRIPFMRLPNDFFDTLPPPKGWDGDYENYSEEIKASYMRVPEEGGNGISPIFWYKWWDDKLCNGNNIRIREIAVYGRTGPMGISEQAFYIPHLRTKLPDGSRQLQREEEKDKDYDQKRRSEQEIMMDSDAFNESDESQSFEKEMANFKSTADRRMLQTVYDLSPDQSSEVGEIAESLKAETIEDFEELERKKSSNQLIDVDPMVEKSKDTKNDATNDNGQAKVSVDFKKGEDIIRSISKSALRGEGEEVSDIPKKKDKVKPENNPILQNWKQRSTMAAKIQEDYSVKKDLPPFPSDEHFAGIWRLITSPGGPIMDEAELMDAIQGDPNSSENLILRIDRTTAGGPILDVENQQRAAGGTWKYFQAEWCGLPEDDDDDTERPVQTRLRVRLLIPPGKDKILVMEGEVKRGSITSAESISRENAKELFASSSFGLNKVAARADRKKSETEEDDQFMYVSGEAWVEEASGDRRRKKLGRFSLMKRKDRNPDQYTYTIPAPTRYQD